MPHRSFALSLARSFVVLAALALVATGCGDDGDDGAGTSTGSGAATDAMVDDGMDDVTTDAMTDETQTFSASAANGVVDGGGQKWEVTEGDMVELTVSSDADDELHLHGYDLVANVDAGSEGTITLVADQPGVFELELHDAGLVANLQVNPA